MKKSIKHILEEIKTIKKDLIPQEPSIKGLRRGILSRDLFQAPARFRSQLQAQMLYRQSQAF